MSVNGLAEVVLFARDMERSADFYEKLLGLTVISPPHLPNRFLRATPDGVFPPAMIVLVPHPGPASSPGPRPTRALHHLALALDAGSAGAVRERLRQAGIEVREGKHPVLQGVVTFYADDPDGNEV